MNWEWIQTTISSHLSPHQHPFQKALAKDPAQRFASVADFARALEQVSLDATIARAPSPTLFPANPPLLAGPVSSDVLQNTSHAQRLEQPNLRGLPLDTSSGTELPGEREWTSANPFPSLHSGPENSTEYQPIVAPAPALRQEVFPSAARTPRNTAVPDLSTTPLPAFVTPAQPPSTRANKTTNQNQPLSPLRPRSRKKPARPLFLLLFALALLLIGGGLFAFFASQGIGGSGFIAQKTASAPVSGKTAAATGPAQTARATSATQSNATATQQLRQTITPAPSSTIDATKLSPQELYNTVTHMTPVYPHLSLYQRSIYRQSQRHHIQHRPGRPDGHWSAPYC